MIEHIERLLKSRIGLDAESIGRSVIERAVRQRMNAIGQPAIEHYWTTLSGSPREQQALVEAVVVPETWFFRYPESFNALAGLALERLAQLGGSRPLRLISLPCSSGEEPYSIAMALLDAGLAPSQFHIDALDVSDKVLELARRGLYGRNSFRGQPLDFRQRHFHEQAGGFLLDARVRACVSLRTGNLLDPGLFAGQAPYDFIFCRNLLIYFDRPTQVRVLESLKRQLHKGGTLFIGPAEASLASQSGLQAIGRQQTFAFCLAPARPVPPQAPQPSAPRLRPPPVARPIAPARPRSQPSAIAPVVPVVPATRADDAWQTVAELANAGRTEQAWQRCQEHLQTHGPSAEAYYWLGLLSDVQNNVEQACAYYRKAIYLDPQHREALTHLAAHLQAQGDPNAAQRLYRRAQTPEVGKRD
ncbi:putative biofilm formation methyltransferase WspC [Pseudomonas sp. 8Z]|uniref:CheR family methyltransferase n=1 Tax=Pseudomonas sp. 8Z TaxID=2653166 RepID=UPI0012F093BA|nr:CheR family methyltransferase [Pseudomonas sp. 8Z]VXC81811.1 putative biofilm formation methyltransferase WspC [Pseudomonas sp. 8Z]